MRFILEGPDNAGKTSLANKVVHTLGPSVHYFHPGGKPDSFEAEGQCIEDQLHALSMHTHIIMDRCTPISQQVYNPDAAIGRWRQHMWSRYLALGVVVIYCRPSTDKLLRVQDLTWRPDETEEHKEKIIRNQHLFVQRYDDLMHGIPNLSYDFEDTAHAEIIYQKMVQALKDDQAAIQWFRNIINLRD